MTDPYAAPPRQPRNRLVFALSAVVVGVAIGFAATVLDGPDEDVARPPAATSAPSTTTTTAAPQPGGNPAYAPVLRPLDDQGDRITLTWTDPSGGNAEFVVLDVSRIAGATLGQLPAGVATYTVEGLDPDESRYCYQVLAFGLSNPAENRGASAEVCTDR